MLTGENFSGGVLLLIGERCAEHCLYVVAKSTEDRECVADSDGSVKQRFCHRESFNWIIGCLGCYRHHFVRIMYYSQSWSPVLKLTEYSFFTEVPASDEDLLTLNAEGSEGSAGFTTSLFAPSACPAGPLGPTAG
jgi:hypothetical protein